jgi:hypothetical protein
MGANNSDTAGKPTKRVGYGTPPENTRFKKGTSGNPAGRRKGSLNVATVFLKALNEKVVISENGQRKTVTKLEAALKQLVNKAASGELRALRQLLELARDAEARQHLPGVQNAILNDLDHEVIQGILERFPEVENSGSDIQEEKDAKNHSS